ncbi:Pseudouridine synthase OS=Lysinibacillus sphaericus OX=1421 GN=LS41612_18270 PE=3 SV=1 [Lysinibacillus sphaericus]
MVVDPAPGHLSGSFLVNGLMYHCTDLSGINGIMRPGIVHRIDKDTSGLLMVAKNDKAHKIITFEQLVNKTVTRKYTALVHGTYHSDTTRVYSVYVIGCGSRSDCAVILREEWRLLQRFQQQFLVVFPSYVWYHRIKRFTYASRQPCGLW